MIESEFDYADVEFALALKYGNRGEVVDEETVFDVFVLDGNTGEELENVIWCDTVNGMVEKYKEDPYSKTLSRNADGNLDTETIEGNFLLVRKYSNQLLK